MIICDTGPFVALSNVKDRHYEVANDLFRALRMTGEQIALADGRRADGRVGTDLLVLPLGATDASVVAVAERLGLQEIATFDRRHFPSLTPAVGGHFQLLPETLP